MRATPAVDFDLLRLIGGPVNSDDPLPAEPPHPRHRLILLAAALVVLAVVGTVLGVVLTRGGRATASSLPIGPTGASRAEQTGKFGANLFADPRTLADQQMAISPHTFVQVGCRFYFPEPSSVTPDGYWYRIVAPARHAGQWAPANSFMNGDRIGGPTMHNTDLAVPVCR